MITAESFVEAARGYGFQRYTGVPCSYLTPFINYVINDDKLNYISSANEGDALATAAGSAIGGKRSVVMMQNSGLGNAVSPLSSLTYIFRIPLLIIASHRGAPGLKDEPQHRLMGEITGKLFELMRVPWAGFPSEQAGIGPALKSAADYLETEQRPYGFIIEKDTVAPHTLARDSIPVRNSSTQKITSSTGIGPTASRSDALTRIIANSPLHDTVIIATTGYSGRELFAIDDRSNQLYMVGSMGCASSLGLGLALARPDLKVVIVDGDGAAMMRMGNFATIGTYGGVNLIHILLDNEVHDSTGAQATVAGNVAFGEIAAACGYGLVCSGNDPAIIDQAFSTVPDGGPRFVHLKTRPGTMDKLPRPDIAPENVVRRLMHHIGTTF